MRVAQWTLRDLRWGSRQWVINTIAGSRVMPRVGRYAIYRLLGLSVLSPDISSGVTIVGRRLSVAADSFINHEVYIDAAGGVEIGSGCAVGPRVVILSTSHVLDGDGWKNDLVQLPTTIGNQVWLGAGATVLPGCTIADGCIVAAGSVVSGSIATKGLYAGSPARLKRAFS